MVRESIGVIGGWPLDGVGCAVLRGLLRILKQRWLFGIYG